MVFGSSFNSHIEIFSSRKVSEGLLTFSISTETKREDGSKSSTNCCRLISNERVDRE